MGALPGLRFLERLPDGRPLAEFVGGVLDGRSVVLHGWRVDFTDTIEITHVPAPPPKRCKITPSLRAEELLLSLLDDRQRAGWRHGKHFWVRTPLGEFLLGTLYDIRFRPAGDAHQEWSICVVPKGWEEGRRRPFPLADLWTNLVLALRRDPSDFLWRANVRGVRDLSDRQFSRPPASIQLPLLPH